MDYYVYFTHNVCNKNHTLNQNVCLKSHTRRQPGQRLDHAVRAARRFAELCEPYDGFHGMVFAEESTVAPFALRARREGLRDFGAAA